MSLNSKAFIFIVIVYIGFLGSSCSAQATTAVVYATRTSSCTSAWGLGQAIFCCNGACIDGTGDEDPSGLCKYFADGCNDPVTPPACASNKQVFVFDNFNGQDAGIAGTCYYWCTWGQFNYTWSCCDCPQGYTAVAHTCAQLVALPNSYECMGCPPGFALTPDTTLAGSYVCTNDLQLLLCDLGRDVKKAFDIAGRVSTFVGAVCPALHARDVVASIIQTVYEVIQTRLDPSDTGAQLDLSITVVAAIKSFLLGAAIVLGAAAAGVSMTTLIAGAAIFTTTCDWNTVIGLAVSALGGLDAYLLQKCPSLSSKRSISERAWDQAIPAHHNTLAQRDNIWNPCSELLNYFPSDYSSMADFNDACNQLQLDDPSGMNDTTISDAMTSLQQLCATWWDSGTADFMISFANMLGAIQAAVPICNTTISLTSTSSAAASSTSSGSFASSNPSTTQSPISSAGSPSSSLDFSLSTSSLSLSSTNTDSASSTLSTSSDSVMSPTESSTVVSPSTSNSLSTISSSSTSSLVSTTSSSSSISSSSTSSSLTPSSSSISTSSQTSTTNSGSIVTTSSSIFPSASSQTSSSSSSSSSESSSTLIHSTSTSISQTSSSLRTSSQSSSPTTKPSSIPPKTSSSSRTSSQSHSSSTHSTSTSHSPASRLTSTTSSTATHAPTWSPIGCYTDNVRGRGRTLTTRASIPGGSAHMTVQACEAACQKASYIYAGLEFSKECWCGNVLANGGVYVGPDGTSRCTDACAGNKTQVCGGRQRLSVYFYG